MNSKRFSQWGYYSAFAILEIAGLLVSSLLFHSLQGRRLEDCMLRCCIYFSMVALLFLTIYKRHWIFANDSRFLIFVCVILFFIFIAADFWILQALLYGNVIAYFFTISALLYGGCLFFLVHYAWSKLNKIARIVGIFSVVLFIWFGAVDSIVYYANCPRCHTKCYISRTRICGYPIDSNVMRYCSPDPYWQYPNPKICLHSFTATPKLRLLGLVIPIYLYLGDEYLEMFGKEVDDPSNIELIIR